MGNRFGRNQKRRMRAQLAECQQALEMECGLTRYLRAKGQRDAETVNRVAEVLGRHFAALEPETIRVNDVLRYLRLPTARRESLETPFYGSPHTPQVRVAMRELEINWVELQGERLTGQQFVRVDTPGGAVGYALSGGMVIRENAERLAMSVTDAMTPHLIAEFRKLKN